MHKCCWRETTKELDHVECLCVDGNVELKWFLRSVLVARGLDLFGPRKGHEAGYSECVREPWRSIKYGEFLFWMRTYYLLNKGFASWGY
jgi:hypothetical protein